MSLKKRLEIALNYNMHWIKINTQHVKPEGSSEKGSSLRIRRLGS